MHLSYRNNHSEYYLGNHRLESVNEEKDLGIYITDNLKPTKQCQQAYYKASRALGLIGRTISYKSKAVLLRLYKTLVRPHVEYCVSAWSYYVKDKQLLERMYPASIYMDGSWVKVTTIRRKTKLPWTLYT